MQTEVKTKLTAVGKNSTFKDAIEKLTLNEELSDIEKTQLLSVAILFLTEYEKDKTLISYADFAYYIILKYSIITGDYKPLYDFCINFGFYPIVNTILSNNLLPHLSLGDYVIGPRLSDYIHPTLGYIETFGQLQERSNFIEDFSFEKSFIAPTSFGKSSMIVEYIKNLPNYQSLKIAVIVPTKSLLVQTYQMIKKGNQFDTKIIIHDDMYDGQGGFIGILTQERALRLLKKDVSFDVIIVDEAHLIFENERGILISRTITQNSIENKDQKIVYLSPLVKDIDKLRVSPTQHIAKHHIQFNLKEPEFFEFKTSSKEIFKYNRFVNQFYKIGDKEDLDYLGYIKINSGDKNLLFENSPKKIELLAKELSESLADVINISDEISQLKKVLSEKVHEEYFAIKYLDHGVIYLHGQLPSLIKEYLEHKYKTMPSLKYLVANTVILEGMNFPTDTLFICGSAKNISNGKSLLNLIGRVNRLDKIFKDYRVENLKGLLPNVHILSSKENGHDSKFVYLRSRVFDDVVKNPTLEAFDIDKVGPSKNKKEDRERFIDKMHKAQEYEKFLYLQPKNEKEEIKRYFIENGINNYYFDLNPVTEFFYNKKVEILSNDSSWKERSMMEKIADIFISNPNNIDDFEFKRLVNKPAQKYYDGYFKIAMVRSLKENIKWQVDHFREVIKEPSFPQKKVYIGAAYGDTTWITEDHRDSKREVFANLLDKTPEDLVNIAIVKLQIEENFASFTLNKFIRALYDHGLITEEDFNLYVYGTNDKEKIALQKQGLSLNLVGRLSESGQLKNIEKDSYNNLYGNDEFKKFLAKVDDFYRFEIGRYIS